MRKPVIIRDGKNSMMVEQAQDSLPRLIEQVRFRYEVEILTDGVPGAPFISAQRSLCRFGIYKANLSAAEQEVCRNAARIMLERGEVQTEVEASRWEVEDDEKGKDLQERGDSRHPRDDGRLVRRGQYRQAHHARVRRGLPSACAGIVKMGIAGRGPNIGLAGKAMPQFIGLSP